MWKPLAILVGLMIVVGFATCTIQKNVFQVNARGEPLDHIGGMIACPICQKGTAFFQGRNYEFECDTCRATYRARRGEHGEIQVNW